MVELAEKLKEGSLSPESVLYSYVGKVSDTSSMGEMLLGVFCSGGFQIKKQPFAERTNNAEDHNLSILWWLTGGLWANEQDRDPGQKIISARNI